MSQYYFAFGSNMARGRICARLPNAQRVGAASLQDYRLDFDMISLDGSGKCTVHPSKNEQVFGVVWQLTDEEVNILTNIEGPRYDLTPVQVTLLENGKKLNAVAYIANTFDKVALPYDWYVDHVYRGAIEAQLPQIYIDSIKTQASVEDTNQARAVQERNIYLKDYS